MISTPQQHQCPHCKQVFDTATGKDELHHRAPRPGDASICVECAAVMVFLDDMSVREMTFREYCELPMGCQLELCANLQALRLAKADQASKPKH